MRNLTHSVRWLLIIIIIATAVRLYRLQSQSIWFDEGWSAFAAEQSTLRDAIAADPTNPPLYYTILNISTHGFGDSLFGLRVVSVFFGILVIPLSFQLARRLFDYRSGLYAAFLVAFSPLMWWASQEARMYSLLAVLALIAAIAWHQSIRHPHPLTWVALWMSELGMLYTHNTGPVMVLWLNVMILLFWSSRRSVHQPAWRIWFAGQLTVGILWLPLFITRFLDLQQANSTVNSPPQLNMTLPSHIWQAFWTGPWEMVGQVDAVVILSGIALVVAVVIVPWRQSATRWLVLHVAITVAGLIAGLTILGNQMHGRYLVMITPLVLVAIAAGIARVRRLHIRLIATGLFSLLFIVSIQAAQNPIYGHDDARTMVRYYRDVLSSADTVLAWSYADRYELAYYWDRMNVRADRITLPEGADLDWVLPLLPDAGRVALNVWYTQRADFRGMMACVLGHGTRNTPEKFITYGMESQLYDDARQPLPVSQSVEFDFVDQARSVARLISVPVLPTFTADRAACLPLEIEMASAVDVDLKGVVIVRNQLHQEIARTDATFAQADQRISSQAEAGALLTAFPVLRLPVGTLPGQYDVILRIYDEVRMPSGYDVIGALGSLHGKDVSLGLWRVTQGADWATTNRHTALSQNVQIGVGDDLVLAAHNISDSMTLIVNGSLITPTFLWFGDDALPTLVLQAEDDSWQLTIPPSINGEHDNVTLDWRVAQIPLDASAGDALLRLPDGTTIARYHVEELPAIYDLPESDMVLDEVIPRVGTLKGLQLEGDSFSSDAPLNITLLWRADETPDVNYTVFAQLLNQDGVLIAQSDAVPAQGSRPTTGWRPGEYIIDEHRLRFNDRVMSGSATLIVGMYDSRTGDRIIINGDNDFIVLPVSLHIQ